MPIRGYQPIPRRQNPGLGLALTMTSRDIGGTRWSSCGERGPPEDGGEEEDSYAAPELRGVSAPMTSHLPHVFINWKPSLTHISLISKFTTLTSYQTRLVNMGAIFSAIGAAINAVVSAIASIIMIIVSVIVTIIVTIFDIIFDILCCNCFGGRTRRTGTHRYRFGGRGAATY